MAAPYHEEYLKALGQRLRMLRMERKLSQRDLAAISDVDFRQIGRIERAEVNPTVNSLINICNGLEITLSELFNFHVHESN